MSQFVQGDSRINKNGAPTKEQDILTWFKAHPAGTISECSRELHISKPTVRKWRPRTIQATIKKFCRIWSILKE